MRAAAVADVGRINGPDQALHREHSESLSVNAGSGRLLDLRERRTALDFAHQMRKLADEHYPEAEKIRVVLDNLNTHTPAAL